MAKCAQCGADTLLFANDVPLCLDCVDRGEAIWEPDGKRKPPASEEKLKPAAMESEEKPKAKSSGHA